LSLISIVFECCMSFMPLLEILRNCLSPFSRWTWISQYQNVSILDFIGSKGDGSVVQLEL